MAKLKASDPSGTSKPAAAKTTNSTARDKRKGEDFGLEGTNKTVPVPQPNTQPADELLGTKSKFIPKSPYSRG